MQYPVHVQNLGSVREVEAAIKRANSRYRPGLRRFRANICVAGPAPFVETRLLRLAIRPPSTADSKPSEPLVLSMPARAPLYIAPDNVESTRNRLQTGIPLHFLQHERHVIDEESKSPTLGMLGFSSSQALGTVRVGDEVAFYKPGHQTNSSRPESDDQKEFKDKSRLDL